MSAIIISVKNIVSNAEALRLKIEELSDAIEAKGDVKDISEIRSMSSRDRIGLIREINSLSSKQENKNPMELEEGAIMTLREASEPGKPSSGVITSMSGVFDQSSPDLGRENIRKLTKEVLSDVDSVLIGLREIEKNIDIEKSGTNLDKPSKNEPKYDSRESPGLG